MAENLQGTDVTGTPSKWSKIQPLEGEVAQTLEDIKNTVDPVFKAITVIANLIKNVLSITVNLLIDFADPEKLAVLAALEAVRTMLDDLVGEAGFYFIGIPIIPIDKELADEILYPKNPGDSLVERFEPLSVAVKENRIGSGGNYGFLTTVAASLADHDDPFKPTFGNDAHVAGVVVYFGAESFLKVVALIKRLITLFSGGNPSGLSEAMQGATPFPQPTNLVAAVAPSSSTSAMLVDLKNKYSDGTMHSPYSVLLTWDIDNEVHVLPWPNETATGNETLKITHVMIYRDKKPIPTVSSTRKLSALQIKKYEFNSWVSEFFDDGIELGKNYHYAVGYEMVELDEDGNESSVPDGQPFNIATTQISLPSEMNIFSRKGTPPDWSVLPSPLALIPSVTNMVRRIHAVLDAIENALGDRFAKLKKYLKNLERYIESQINWVQDIVNTVEDIIDALNWTGIYAGVTGFEGKGGNAFMMHELGQALSDPADPNRPPFDKGTEAVCGFIMYAGSTTAGGIEKFMRQLEFLWGINLSSLGTGWDQIENAWDTAKEAVDIAIDEVERQICLSDNLRSLIDCPEEEQETGTKLNQNLQPPDTDTISDDESCVEE